jgi:hypothetical protein
MASGYFRRPVPKVLPPDEFEIDPDSRQGQALEGSRVYFPYFSIKAVFDNAATRSRLDPAGIVAAPLREYLDRLLDFATRTRWGKRPIARGEALAS